MAEPTNAMPKSLRIESPSGQPTETKLKRSIVIGRALDCDFVLKDVKASRYHCRLTRSETEYLLEDLNSKNGTFVDGKRISEPVSLKLNQTFKIGDTIFYLAP